MIYLMSIAAALFISMALMPPLIRLAPRLRMVDMPDPRKVHTHPVARIGGLAIASSALASMILWLSLEPAIYAYLFGSAALVVFGVWDDACTIGHYPKFIGQALAVLPVVYLGELYVPSLPFMGVALLPEWFAKLFTVFALVGMINAVNHSDGLDGLAGGETLFSLLAIGFLGYQTGDAATVIIAVSTLGGLLGFLRFNTYPARVFMGDAGSQFLGYTVGFLMVWLIQRANSALSPAVALLILGLPIADILMVFWLRATGGMNWFHATRNHVHHRLLDLGFNQHESVVLIYGLQGLLVISGVVLRYESDALLLGIYASMCVALFAALTVAERSGWQAHGRAHLTLFSRVVATIRQHRLIGEGAALIVLGAMMVYMLGVAAAATHVPRDFAWHSLALIIVMLLVATSPRLSSPIVIRAIVYTVAAYVLYLSHRYAPESLNSADLQVVYFGVLAVAISCAVRYGLGLAFRTTPMDYLITFAVVGIGVVASVRGFQGTLAAFVIKGVILAYACEVLVVRRAGLWTALNGAAFATLCVLCVRGFLDPGASTGGVEVAAWSLR